MRAAKSTREHSHEAVEHTEPTEPVILDRAAELRRDAAERTAKLERLRVEHRAGELGVSVAKLMEPRETEDHALKEAFKKPSDDVVEETPAEERRHVQESIRLSEQAEQEPAH